jgi:hypothetical protein
MTKHQNDTHMLIGALRKTSYGPSFAKGCADNERLSDVLAKDASLRRVILDYEAARLEQISRSWKHNTALGSRGHPKLPSRQAERALKLFRLPP